MKNVIKFVLSFICYLIFIPCIIGVSIAATWYILPTFQNTAFGVLIKSLFTAEQLLIVTGSLILGTMFFGIMGKVFTVIKSSKALNFYTHIVSWLTALMLAAEASYSFIASEVIHTAAIDLDSIRKIGILACVLALLIYSLIVPKVRIIVNRRIQAYDTAKELNAAGRSSVVGMQILKCLDFICPEIFLLIALCFSFNWEISLYFIFIICAFILPILGNMIYDHRVKREAKKIAEETIEAQVNATAEAVVQLINRQSNGD